MCASKNALTHARAHRAPRATHYRPDTAGPAGRGGGGRAARAGGRMGGRREDQLAVRIEKLVEQVEELFLRAFLPGQELNVVEQERGGAAIACPPPIHAIPVDRRDQLVDERLSRQTGDNRALLLGQLETDGVQQVRLAESALPDNYERIVFL